MKKALLLLSLLFCQPVFAGQNVTGNLIVTGNVGIGSVNPVAKLDVISSSFPAIRASGPTNGGDYPLLVSSSVGGQSNLRISSAFNGSGYGVLASGEPTQGTFQFYCSEATNPECTNANYQRMQFFGNPLDFMIAPTDFNSRQSVLNLSSKGNAGFGVQPDNSKIAAQGLFLEPGTISDDGGGSITCDSSNCGFSSRLGFVGGESLYINGNLYQIDFVNDDNSLNLTNPSDAFGANYYYVPTYIASFLTYWGDPALIVAANGYVGVGTYPSYNLDIAGTGHFSSNVTVGGNISIGPAGGTPLGATITMYGTVGSGFPGIDFVDTNEATAQHGYLVLDQSSNGMILGMLGNNAITFRTNNIDRFRVQPDGNIGIGTTVPRSLLEVGLGKLNVLSGGNVGIGSITPGQALDVQGTVRIAKLGSTLAIASGTNGCQGQATLSSGLVTVTTACTPSTSQGIFLTDAQTSLLNVGSVTIATVTAGSSFVVQSTNVADGSKVNWTIIKSN